MDYGLVDWKFDRSMELRKKEVFIFYFFIFIYLLFIIIIFFSQSFANCSELTIETKYFNIGVLF